MELKRTLTKMKARVKKNLMRMKKTNKRIEEMLCGVTIYIIDRG
jgi:hypothetical protein